MLDIYNQNLADGRLADPHQLRTVLHLDKLHSKLLEGGAELYEGPDKPPPHSTSPSSAPTAPSFFSSLFSKVPSPTLPALSSPPNGLYIHGGVGCGKTYLMNLFHASISATLSLTCIQKVHFHSFMLNVHKSMHLAKQSGHSDPLPYVVANIISKGKIICFDEFQVTDVADAMILRRLFTLLYAESCVFVSTSNRPPMDLYKNGLQRDLFVPFLHMLGERNGVVSMDESETDYRLVHGKLQAKGVYFLDGEEGGKESFEEVWGELVGEATVKSMNLRTQGRNVLVPASVTEKNLARMHFFDLCGKSKGAADYLVIGETFETIFIDGIPTMEIKDMNMVRRFITLIDALYECECKVVILAKARPEGLFVVDLDGQYDEMFAFDRTRSRLDEMMSTQWMSKSRKNIEKSDL